MRKLQRPRPAAATRGFTLVPVAAFAAQGYFAPGIVDDRADT